MIDVHSENLVGLAEAGLHLPAHADGKRIHPSTLYRWARTGFSGVRLETIRVGRRLCTSRQALQRFCEGLSVGGPHARAEHRRRSTDERRLGPAKPSIAWGSDPRQPSVPRSWIAHDGSVIPPG